MKILVSWLRDFVDVTASPEEIASTMSVRGFAVESLDPTGDGDAVIDFEVTANRPDCLSVIGFAREIGTAFNLPVRSIDVAPHGPSARTHQLDPSERFESPHEYSTPLAPRTGHEVCAVVHPVREVDVQQPRGAEHHPVARGLPAVTVTGGIVRPIGLGLHDPARALAHHQDLVEQVTGYLDGVTLEVGAGEFVGLLGTSGSGKSTLLNLIAGLDQPTGGALLVFGDDLATMSRQALSRHRQRNVGIIFQSFNLISTMSAQDNVALAMLFAGVPRADRKSVV